MTQQSRVRRWAALWVWAYIGWIVLTWTKTAEQLIFGAVAAGLVALVLMPLGSVVEPWRVVDPRRLVLLVRIAGHVLVHLVGANVSLSRRIWSPSRPLRPGMVVVPTAMSSDAELTAVGLLTSLVVDNQIVDLDRGAQRLQYHAVWSETADPDANRAKINGPLEDLLAKFARR
jgi:multicomponent Na+:H+ antiporter subunit E